MEAIVVLLVGFEVIVGEMRHRVVRSAPMTADVTPNHEPGVLLPHRIGIRLGLFIIIASSILWTIVYVTYRAAPSLRTTGRIVWNMEQAAQGGAYFLSMTKLNNQEIRVLGFQAHGKNNSSDPLLQFSGFMRSDFTNAQIPIYLQAQDPEESKALACFPHPWIPTSPDQTYGVPALADFDIGTYDRPTAEMGKDGVPVSQFLNTFIPFTVVLEYDGKRIERQFSKDEINKQIEIFEKSLNPLSNPHVLRKADATPPRMPSLRLLPPSPATPVPSLTPPSRNEAPTGTVPPKN
jgi:hypothetical protein